MPTVLIIALAKLILKSSRLLGRGGGAALPGLFAERLDPSIGLKLARRIPHGSIIVTGTNGKTTTSKMLAQILTDSGEKLVRNTSGSNLSRGIVSALIEHASWNGSFKQTQGLFEVDEAAMPAVAAMVQPRAIVVLNLFRDQLDRYGELDTTAGLIGRGIAATTAELFLNADDPLVASLAQYADRPEQVYYFGIDDAPSDKLAHDVTADSDTCPVCGRALRYDKNFFGHIGHYACPEGHFNRPKPSAVASRVVSTPAGSSFSLATSSEKNNISIQLPGLYNVYNALAAGAVAHELGIPSEDMATSLENVEAAFGRVEQVTVNGRPLYLLLVKNPTGFNQIIQTFLSQKTQQQLLLIINDNFADGRDVSWLWDVAFEELSGDRHIIDASGIRATDMALRLKYADIATRNVDTDIEKSLNQFIAQLDENQIGYIIPTYTAMIEARRLLGKKTKLSGVWQS
jgi:UDP-N-acetylmuramyl tripeptide synthase